MASKFLDQKNLMTDRCSLTLPAGASSRLWCRSPERRAARCAYSLDRSRVGCEWDFTITENYIKCCNRDVIFTTGLSPYYLKIPCLKQILKHHIPDYRFCPSGCQGRLFECMFLVYGNSTKGKTWFEPIFLKSSNQEVCFCLNDGRRHIFKERSLIFHLVPLNVFVHREIILEHREEEGRRLTLARASRQELLELDGIKNTLLLSGPALSDPFTIESFLATDLPEALESTSAAINGLPKQKMAIKKLVGRGSGVTRVVVDAAPGDQTSLCLTLQSGEVPLSFEKNPCFGAVFTQGTLFLPLTYQGSPQVVRPFMCKKLVYANTYRTRVCDLTCLVVGKETQSPLLIEEKEWKPGKPLHLLVTNPTKNPVIISDGFRLGSCAFARIPTVGKLPKSVLKKLPGIITFPGNCLVRSTRLERVLKTCHYFNSGFEEE